MTCRLRRGRLDSLCAVWILQGSAEDESHFYVAFLSVGHSQSPSPVPGCLSVLDLQVLNVFEPSVPLSNLVKIGRRLHKLLGKVVRRRHTGKERGCVSSFREESGLKILGGGLFGDKAAGEMGSTSNLSPVREILDWGLFLVL